MILFLTYHQVIQGTEAAPAFYTIRAELLERQLELLARSGFQPLSPEELPDYRPGPNPACVLSFDDGTEDHHDVVLPLLSRYKWRAIFFVPTAKLNRDGH